MTLLIISIIVNNNINNNENNNHTLMLLLLLIIVIIILIVIFIRTTIIKVAVIIIKLSIINYSQNNLKYTFHLLFKLILFKPFSKPTMALKTSMSNSNRNKQQYDANKFGANIGSLFTCTWAGTWWPAELCRRPSDAGNCWRGTGSCAPSEQHITDREHSRFLQRDTERGQLSLKYQPHFLLFI